MRLSTVLVRCAPSALALMLYTGAGCGGGGAIATGNEGEPCFANDTCNDPWVCLAGFCVAPPDCTPGDSQACECAGGYPGTQTCDVNETWAACECVLDCEPGTGDCDGDTSNGCEASFDTPEHCGGCDAACNQDHATATCAAGQCELTCDVGFDDCDGDVANGCEADLEDVASCGDCVTVCGGACAGGVCETCDGSSAVDTNDPWEAAWAMGLCDGVVNARWVLPDGATAIADPDFPLGHGLLDGFGPNVNVQEGVRMLGLSSGAARQPTDPGYQSPADFDKGYTSGSPTGFPKESPACPGVTTGEPHDGVALELTLAVPPTAQGFSFDFKFYTYEWPQFICSIYNDFFVAMLDPVPAGQSDGNITFDQQSNPVSVNAAFIEVCGCAGGPPCTAGGKSFGCALGTGELMGTGFGSDTEPDDHGATGWLRTSAPAAGGTTITLRFGIYDSGDGVLDSSVLIDNFRWISSPTTVNTIAVPDPQ